MISAGRPGNFARLAPSIMRTLVGQGAVQAQLVANVASPPRYCGYIG